MKHYCDIMKVILNSIFIPSSEGPPGKLWENYIKNGVFWAHFEVLINLYISITENLLGKNVSRYI